MANKDQNFTEAHGWNNVCSEAYGSCTNAQDGQTFEDYCSGDKLDCPYLKSQGALVKQTEENQLVEFVKKIPGLGKSLVPILGELEKKGFTFRQLEAIVDIPSALVEASGSATKTKYFLNAIKETYSHNEFAYALTDYGHFKDFLSELREVEEMKEDFSEAWPEGARSYRTMFNLVKEVGPSRARLLLGNLSEKRGALKLVDDLLGESLKTGISPETLLDFRREEIDHFFYEDGQNNVLEASN